MGKKMRMIFFVAIAFLSSCVVVPNRAWWQPHDSSPVDQYHNSKRMVIEIDEKGPIFFDDQFQRLQLWLENESPDMPVVLFVNGWHHNAQVSDSNLRDFNGFIGKVEDAAAGAPVVGVYIGWRGDSLDTPFGWEPSDFVTIWGRKKASVDVGEKGLWQILDYLRTRFPDRQVFVVGHSLGGSALFHAVKRNLASDANDGFEYIMLNPAVAEREFREVEQEFLQAQTARLARSNADILTAKVALQRAHRKITVMQSLGDVPVKILYRIAFLNTPIGFDKKRITHRAYGCGDQDICQTEQDTECTVVLADGKFIIETARTKGGTCRENNLKPVWVISTAGSVSANHGDILNSVQARALADLLGARIRFRGQEKGQDTHW